MSPAGVAMSVSGQAFEDEFEEPTDASGEINGKWYGLCPKNSIETIEDFRQTVQGDVVLAAYYVDFDWERARVGRQAEETMVHVAYRRDDVIRQTKKLVKLPKGDQYITDGRQIVRTACCNDYTVPPLVSPAAGSPPEKERVSPVVVPKAAPAGGMIPVESFSEPLYLPPTFPPRETVPYFPPERRPPVYPPVDPPPYSPPPYEPPPPGPPTDPVPEPATMVLFGTGLGVLAAVARKKKKSN